jgi:hypothetical protein
VTGTVMVVGIVVGTTLVDTTVENCVTGMVT